MLQRVESHWSLSLFCGRYRPVAEGRCGQFLLVLAFSLVASEKRLPASFVPNICFSLSRTYNARFNYVQEAVEP